MDFEKLTDIEQAREKHVKVKKHFMRSQSKEIQNQLGSKMITLTNTPNIRKEKSKPKKTDTLGDIMNDWDEIAKYDNGPTARDQTKTGV